MSRKLRTILAVAVAAALTLGAQSAALAALALVSGNPPQGPAGSNALVTVNADGLPLWYQDQQLLRLEECPAGDAFCTAAIAPEAFYWDANATLTLAGGGTADITLALEANFGSLPLTAFQRIRVRFLNAAPGTYTMVHPFGTTIAGQSQFLVGAGATTFTEDVPAALPVGEFIGALSGPVGPNFLTAVNPPPPAGHIGDVNVTQTVTGSRFPDPANPGQFANLFRVSGPGGTAETNLFLVGGRLCTTCGANTAPVLVDDPVARVVAPGQPIVIPVIANDQPGDGVTTVFPNQDVPIDPARVTIVTPPANGTAVADDNGNVTYTANPGFGGADTFTYTATDFGGLPAATPATVTVQVEDLRVTVAELRGKLLQWNIQGQSLGTPAATVDLRRGSSVDGTGAPNGAPIALAVPVNPDGSWSFTGKSTTSPGGARTISVISSNGVAVVGAPLVLR